MPINDPYQKPKGIIDPYQQARDSLQDEMEFGIKPEMSTYEKTLRKYGKTFVRPGMEIAGAIGGGVVGLPGGPAGAVVGSGAGATLGSQLYHMLEQGAGIAPQRSLAEGLGQTGKDLAYNTALEAGMLGLGKFAKAGVKRLPGMAAKFGESASGVPASAIRRLATHPDDVMAFSKKGAYDAGEDILNEIGDLRRIKLDEYAENVTKAIEQAGKEGKTVSMQPIIDAFSQGKDDIIKIGKYKTVIKEYDEQIKMLKNIQSRFKDEVPVDFAQGLKKELQKLSKYEDPITKQIKDLDTPVGKGFKKAARKTKELVEDVAGKSKGGENIIKSNNAKMKEIYDIETDKEWIKHFGGKSSRDALGKIERTINNAEGAANREHLRRLVKRYDQLVGTNIDDVIKDAHASKYFSNADLFSGFRTGRSPLMAGAGGYIGYGVGGYPGMLIGGALGGAAGSPAAMKAIAPKAPFIQRLLESSTDKLVSRPELRYQIGKRLPIYGGRNLFRDDVQNQGIQRQGRNY